MSRSLVAMLENKFAQTNVGARPTLASDGVDILHWRTNGEFSTPLAALLIDGSLAMTIGSPAGGADGVELWGYRLAQWWRIGVVNDGQDVPIVGPGQGFGQAINVVGVFERLAISGTPSAGAATAILIPIQTWETP